ncbi:GNAT family N-acetyltransferase [Lactococcus kimchii]|uniref:GNAT family N-acetyltransferase n=1 Tax=Lactococcus sp. S-13 TaxID=2507158 RepID=UPI001023EFF5|nr:GNAT family N-acetyltransferase [Lactococcus sp. S-13]RZI48248.1 GNAT family N-acetyltransferase [Lactococcus sp. S-13]
MKKESEMILKKVTLKDVQQLQEISIETFSDTFKDANDEANLKEYLKNAYNIEQLKSELSDLESDFYFVYYKKELAGYLKLNVSNAQSEKHDINALEIERIYIKTHFKRLGLGRYLLNYAINQAKELKKTSVWIGVWEKNINALNFYKKMNFVYFSEHIFKLGREKQRDILMKLVINK